MRYEIKSEQLSKLTVFMSYIYVDGGKSYIDFSTIYLMGKDEFYTQLIYALDGDISDFPEPMPLIFNHMSDAIDPTTSDFTLLGLNQSAWKMKRGKRLERLYLDKQDRVVVKDRYVYETADYDVSSYVRKLEWFDKDGLVVFSKDTEINEGLSSIFKLNRCIRQNKVDYLMDSAIETGVAPLISALTMIFNHYNSKMDNYVKISDRGWENAVRTESDSTILGILNIQTTVVETFPWTVKDAILYQIGDEYLAEFITRNTPV